MKAHAWELWSTDWSEGGATRFNWRCEHCLSDTFTKVMSGLVGSHAAPNYLPGRRALQATWVPEDCDLALVQGVNDA